MKTKSSKHGTNTLSVVEARIERVDCRKQFLDITLADGRVLSMPLEWYPRIQQATKNEQQDWELIGGGIGVHWESLDEDLSLEGFLQGLPSVDWMDQHDISAQDIKAVRHQLAWTQQQLATFLSVRQASVSDWERGRRRPSPWVRRKLAGIRSSRRSKALN
jgi:DNA-binding XRE family transcriptional regulator